MHFAIIGAGPAGLSLAARILKLVPSARINIFEKRNAPYGLARYGVAPDHSDARVTIFSKRNIKCT